MAEEENIETAVAALEYAAARRGLYLTVHALGKVKEVLKWDLSGDREKALAAGKGPPSTDIARRRSTEPKS